jgi:hypothetical protein
MPGDDRVLVNLDLYRACLKAKYWQRVTGAKAGVPIGYFRGQENEGPIRPSDLPAQPRVVPSPPRGQRGSSGPNFGPR